MISILLSINLVLVCSSSAGWSWPPIHFFNNRFDTVDSFDIRQFRSFRTGKLLVEPKAYFPMKRAHGTKRDARVLVFVFA